MPPMTEVPATTDGLFAETESSGINSTFPSYGNTNLEEHRYGVGWDTLVAEYGTSQLQGWTILLGELKCVWNTRI